MSWLYKGMQSVIDLLHRGFMGNRAVKKPRTFITEYQRKIYEDCKIADSQVSEEDLSSEAKRAQYLRMKERKEFPSRKGE